MIAAVVGGIASGRAAQTPASPAFEVASIKRTAGIGNSGIVQRPDGGLKGTNVTVQTLIYRAYLPNTPGNVVGLPGWATRERYNVIATSSLSNPTPGERTAMLRALLADRFRLLAHAESREQPVYDLVLARSDRRLGPGLKPVDTDCERITAERAAALPSTPTQSPDLSVPPPPCGFRLVDAPLRDLRGDRQGRLGDLLEGEGTMANLAVSLRLAGAGRRVVDETALSGSYQVRMNFDMAASRGGPGVAPAPNAAPSMLTAVQEQLGLKLESSQAPGEVIVVDYVERPTEN